MTLSIAFALALLLYYDYTQASSAAERYESVTVSRRVSSRVVSELEAVEVEVSVENRGRDDMPLLEVRDSVPRFLSTVGRPSAAVVVPRGSTTSFTYRVRPLLPGSYVFERVELVFSGPLGMVVDSREVPLRTSITALPLYQTTGVSLKSFERMWGLVVKGRSTGGMYDIAEIREYSPSDDYRKILWKAFARTGRPYVREDYGEVFGRVLLAVFIKLEDWLLGEPPNTLASVELRALRSYIHSLVRAGVSVDLAICCGSAPKVVRCVNEDYWRSLFEAFSHMSPHCSCSAQVSSLADVPTYLGRGVGEYMAVVLIASPLTLSSENPARFLDVLKAFDGRLKVIVPRFGYERFVDPEDLRRLFRALSALLERAGGSLEVMEESFTLGVGK